MGSPYIHREHLQDHWAQDVKRAKSLGIEEY